MKVIGIDIGTTSICGILIDAKCGEVLKSITKNSDAFIKTENEWEKIQDVEKIITMAIGITDELIEEDVCAIGVTGQMHGIVYYDKDGKALSPLYTWQDGRGSLIYKDKKTYSEYLNIPQGYGRTTDFYNEKNNLKPKEAVGYCTIHDFFAMTISGRKTPVIHTSDAASFGDFDIKTNTFNHSFTGEVTGGFDIIGEYKNIPVSVAIGDNQASVFGALKSDDDILLNVGTGSQISVVSTDNINSENTEIRPYMDGKVLVVGAALCGGRAYSLLEKFFSAVVYQATGQKVDMYEVMDKMTLSGENHILADTRFDGTRKNPALSGSIYNITTENFTPGEFKNAILFGIVSELYNLFGEMNVKRGNLVGSGNAIRKNKALVKIAEDMFSAAMKVPKHTEEAAFGACLFAMKACGKFGSIEEVKKIIQYN